MACAFVAAAYLGSHIPLPDNVALPPSLAMPEQPALFDLDEHQQKILDFSENSRPSLSVNNQLIIPTQLISPFAHRLSAAQPSLWSAVVTAELKDSTLRLLRSYDQKFRTLIWCF